MEGSEAKEVLAREMRSQGKSLRRISRALGMGRKRLKRILGLSESPSSEAKEKSSKLDGYMDRARQLAEWKEGPAGAERMLTVKGIFRELRKEGYEGGMTILGDKVREIRGASRAPAAFARYEPAPGLEAQSDWSPYRVLLGGREAKVHVFSMILSYSRFQYLEAFFAEGQDELFQGHVEGFKYFHGIPEEILYDNQSPVAACRIGGKALLNPRFEAFARHYGFRPVVGEPYRKERRGRVERPFGYIESDFLPGRRFSCLEDFRAQLRGWLEGEKDGTGNYRVHGTTRRRPVDMWAEERGLLIELPPADFLPVRIEERIVNKDCTVSVSGNLYTVPPRHAGRKVTVMTTPKEVKVFDHRRELVASHKAAEGKGRMVIDEAHYEEIRRARRHVALPALEKGFLALFPGRERFVDGLKARVKSIYPIHLKHLQALREHFTRMQVDEAMAEAERHGIFTSTYVEEILNRRHPSQVGFRSFDEDMEKPKGFSIGELDPGDPGHYDGIFNEKGKEEVDGR